MGAGANAVRAGGSHRLGVVLQSILAFSARVSRGSRPHTLFAWLHMFAAFVKPFTTPAYGPKAAPLLANHRGRSEHRSSLETSMIEARAQATVPRGQGGMIRRAWRQARAPHNPGTGERAAVCGTDAARLTRWATGFPQRALAGGFVPSLQRQRPCSCNLESRRCAARHRGGCATQRKEAVRGDRPLLALCRGAGCRQ